MDILQVLDRTHGTLHIHNSVGLACRASAHPTSCLHSPSWLFCRKPPNGPDLNVLTCRRQRYRQAMLQHLHRIRPLSRRTAKALAAALALTQLAHQTQALGPPSNLADFHSRVQVLRDIVAPPPTTTVYQECVEAFSIMINTMEAELDPTDMTLCPAPFDSDSGIIGVDG